MDFGSHPTLSHSIYAKVWLSTPSNYPMAAKTEKGTHYVKRYSFYCGMVKRSSIPTSPPSPPDVGLERKVESRVSSRCIAARNQCVDGGGVVNRHETAGGTVLTASLTRPQHARLRKRGCSLFPALIIPNPFRCAFSALNRGSVNGMKGCRSAPAAYNELGAEAKSAELCFCHAGSRHLGHITPL